MAKTIVIGDTHIKHDPLYTQAIEMLFSWLSEQEFNVPENSLLHLGDIFDNFRPTAKDIARAITFLQDKLKFQNKYIITGNYKHSFDALKKVWAEDCLEPIKGIEVIKFIKEIKLGNLNCLILPWFNKSMHPEGLTVKQCYENLPEVYRNKKYDFVFGHIATKEMFSELVDISYLQAKKVVMGHIHKSEFGSDFLGSPLVTRRDESKKKNKIMIIDNDSGEFEYMDVPRFIDYDDINYPEKPKATEVPIMIYDIWEAPSVDIAREHYKDLNLRKNGIHRIAVDSSNSGEVVRKDRLSIKDYMNNFCKERSLPEEQRQILIGVIE